MDAAGGSEGDNRESRYHQEIMSKLEALLKVVVELQVNTSQLVRNSSINNKNGEAASALASASSTLLTPPEEDTITTTTTTTTTDNLVINMERPPITMNEEIIPEDHNDRIEESAEDDGQVMSEDDLYGYPELYQAALHGDWKVASRFLEKNPEAITKVIGTDSQTVLHVAMLNPNLIFIQEIVKLMPPEILEYKTTTGGNTALHYAAIYGYAKAAELMVKGNPNLPQIVNGLGMVPLNSALTAVTAGQRETVEYLYSVTRDEHPSPFSGDQGDSILHNTIDAGFYDIASSIVQRFPELVIDQKKKVHTKTLNYMAEKPFAFTSGAKLTFWQRCIYALIKVDINTTYELDTRASERNLEESLPQSLEGSRGDEEDPVERFESSCAEENYPPGNSENTKGFKGKMFNWETVGDVIVVAIFMVRDQSYYMIKLFFAFLVFLVRSIIPWTPVPRIKQLHKRLYNDKVMHKQAKALVKRIITPLKERMKRVEVVDSFKGSNVMKMAIRHGSVEFVEVCLNLFPYLVWYEMGGQYIIQMAIAERNETILNLICKVSGDGKINLVSKCDDKGNTILHYAAKLAPSHQLNSLPGAYLQMQREMQWFKGVENMVSEKDKFKRNEDGDTAHNIFTEKHKELKENGEKWLKDTSGSCMLVAALIATVAFTSAFTVPGGSISDSNSSSIGTPVFLKTNSFMVFAVADALALFSSITSVLMFLAIYTSRYAEVDFLKSLPNKLILGLTTLFISMASVLVAFGASLFIVLGERFTWALIPIVVFSCVPVTLFGWLQLPLFFDMVRSTYWGSMFREHTYISSLQLNANANKED